MAGPSELVVVASDGADPELVALDLLAQAEHGDDSLLWCISPDPRCSTPWARPWSAWPPGGRASMTRSSS